jgi:hypothetical protein
MSKRNNDQSGASDSKKKVKKENLVEQNVKNLQESKQIIGKIEEITNEPTPEWVGLERARIYAEIARFNQRCDDYKKEVLDKCKPLRDELKQLAISRYEIHDQCKANGHKRHTVDGELRCACSSEMDHFYYRNGVLFTNRDEARDRREPGKSEYCYGFGPKEVRMDAGGYDEDVLNARNTWFIDSKIKNN